jgi:hypothetical protein
MAASRFYACGLQGLELCIFSFLYRRVPATKKGAACYCFIFKFLAFSDHDSWGRWDNERKTKASTKGQEFQKADA